MRRRVFSLAAGLLLGLLASDLAFGAGCDPLAGAPSATTISAGVAAAGEACGPSACASDCFCCSTVSAGGAAPVVLAPGPLANLPADAAPRLRPGSLPLLDHPPQL